MNLFLRSQLMVSTGHGICNATKNMITYVVQWMLILLKSVIFNSVQIYSSFFFCRYYLEWGGGKKRDPSYDSIPCFYTPLPPEQDIILQKLREESRAGLIL